ncbi:hypothetical protein TW95_gp0315 [Pandoravirus inopinatum]|uniref:Transmembrane protein n=1 Tax=Pandoravirus inopinatum TaxID=1605721 RepID=A0A0B5J0Q7_9VIRU|nr:hypothetical protein TW95_gp0315 [Pandoravirus inopinatum]AJF97049.1 hypothetical protein [Pandoravirus inopinatum]
MHASVALARHDDGIPLLVRMPCVGAAPVFSVATSAAVIVYCHYLFSFFFWRVASERVAVRFLFLPALGTTDAKNVLGLGVARGPAAAWFLEARCWRSACRVRIGSACRLFSHASSCFLFSFSQNFS